MNRDYWIDFWKKYSAKAIEKDEHSQVLRTYNKKPISEELWNFTLSQIDKELNVKNNEYILDLCAGNGLLSRHFASKGTKVTAVDISDELLSKIKDIKNILTLSEDIRNLEFDENSFDKIILYAGIQYLNYREAVLLIKNAHRWLKPGGIIFIGDIPDFNKRWKFFNTQERRLIYFDNLIKGDSIVGTWYEIDWFKYLTDYVGFKSGKLLPQNDSLIYSDFRYDYIFIK